MRLPLLLLTLAIVGGSFVYGQIPAIKRKLPPESSLELPADLQKKLDDQIIEYEDRTFYLKGEPYEADVSVFSEAVRLARRHNEFYSEKEFNLPEKLYALADARYAERDAEEPSASWLKDRGLLVRGYRSSIDDSVQPYGLEIPENLDLSKPVPLLVWLHGRGDKVANMQFIDRCLKKSQALGGKIADQQKAIILHPFGRHCVGFKHAGEIDVFEAIEAVKADYPIDPDKIALAGFSMGGAGAWHIGAHYNDQFCAVHAGAGFAETAKYNNLTPENFPPVYEQTLWKTYDVPNYARNLFNSPLLAYSGEDDKQKQAADLMAESIAAAGGELKHIIGPGMGHKYHDDSAREIFAWLTNIWESDTSGFPKKIQLQTPTLRYGKMHWFVATGLVKHWEDSGAEAEWNEADKKISITTKNLTAFRIEAPTEIEDLSGYTLDIDGDSITAESPGFAVTSLNVRKGSDGKWTWGEHPGLTKTRHLQGPIDDAFLNKFVVVPPAEAAANPRLDEWIDFEAAHFENRWIALMRGEFETENSAGVTSKDVADSNLILWGTPESNPIIGEIIDQLPLKWTADTLEIQGQTFDPKTHVPVLIYPNPLAPKRYIVLNSGLTFREGHDRTNSLQNPKLPDWAIINIETPPNDLSPGKIVATGFFSEKWE